MHRHITPPSASTPARAVAICVLAALVGCGGGDFAEQFVKLITARFVPASVTLSRGSSLNVDFEITCDRDGLETAFGRLSVLVKFDPDAHLPTGITVTPLGASPDSEGFWRYPCSSPGASAELRVEHVTVHVAVSAEAATGNYTLQGLVKIEPLDSDQPSKDSTNANLAIAVSASDAPTTPSSAERGHQQGD